MHRVLFLIPSTSYRTSDFLSAARHLGVEIVVGSNHQQALAEFTRNRLATLSFEPIEKGVSEIVALARRSPISTIIGVDEQTTTLAAAASEALGLMHNSTESVATAHDKHRFRCVLERAGILSPWFRLLSLDEDLAAAAAAVPYPCVLKPLDLSASRGVIRVDDAAGFLAACRRIGAILCGIGGLAETRRPEAVLAEAFIPGREVALEGLLDGGVLRPLALFDKPDQSHGPFIEETIYVTPSRLSDDHQQAIIEQTAAAASALGLKNGPIHAELRLNNKGPWVIELAARSIGGLCSRALSFTGGARLEELILRHALGLPISNIAREEQASGVMMIPIPRAGQLQAVTGLDAARSGPCINDVTISVPIGSELVPLPEGDRYLGFIFARARLPGEVEAALRDAHRKLGLNVEPMRH